MSGYELLYRKLRKHVKVRVPAEAAIHARIAFSLPSHPPQSDLGSLSWICYSGPRLATKKCVDMLNTIAALQHVGQQY